ncbi:hypothetical protein LY90DRAFT_664246 [Neocallimastix californiae]|uniref:Endopeptidase S2P n=1 Tax=Neocallimastix californiae TaxID=1754190 RepID=A0A1Y2FCQ3_9FUNG|nr:hypothetical protein LY90DRAFT_664246 [Neocallimastix californiae]|eukprot:ORY81710.1 hypothetical protein LY90DRAFT_664246 [Neocallimastix californiae]
MAFFIFIVALIVFWIIVTRLGKRKSTNDTNSSSYFINNSVLPPNVNSRTIIKFGQIVYQTKSLNNVLLTISQKGKKFWQIWFSLGVFFGLTAIILSTIVLLFSFTISFYTLINGFNCSNNNINININPMVSVNDGLSKVGNSNFIKEFNNTISYQNNTFQYTKNENDVSYVNNLIILKTFSGKSVVINKTESISYDNYIKSLVYGNWNENYEFEESFAEHTAKKYNQFLVSVIPGINLPLWHIGYYILAAFLSGVIHEFGHAIAALIENVSIYSTGSFLYLIFPGAFVNMDDHLLSLLKPFHQLRIFCAGVWHNLWLCIICYICLITMPYWLFLGYSQRNEYYVLDVNKNSPLYGYVNKGSVIHTINDKPIPYGKDGFEIILKQSLIENPINHAGYCVSKQLFKDNDSSCCNVSLEKPLTSSNLQCFEHHESLLDLYEVYMNEKTFNVERKGHYIPVPPLSSKCTNFINIIKNSQKCYVDSDCNSSDGIKQKRYHSGFLNTNSILDVNFNSSNLLKLNKRQEPTNAQENEYLNEDEEEYLKNIHSYDTNLNTYCMTPYIPNPFMRVIKFQVNDYPRDHYPHYREIIFLSDPREVWDSGKIGNYFPKFRFLPFFIPYMIENSLKYIISLSAALSILNMVPSFNLDGYHAFFAMITIISNMLTIIKKRWTRSLSINERFKQLFSSNFYKSLVDNDEEIDNEIMLNNSRNKKKKNNKIIERCIPIIYTALLLVAIVSGIYGALSGNNRSLV